MPDGSLPVDSYTPKKDFFLLEGEAFVTPRREPKNKETKDYILQLAEDLNLITPTTRPTSVGKISKCLSDVLVAALVSRSGLICWPTSRNALAFGPYGGDIAVRVRDSLVAAEVLEKIQAPIFGPYGSMSAVYQIDKNLAPDWLRFKEHDQVIPIEVRDEKPEYRTRFGKKPKGRRISLSKFVDEIDAPLGQMKKLLQGMSDQPLTAPDGTAWSSCKRIFNDCRLDRGGRVYGDWQHRKANERLHFTITGEPVSEIDIKASYLFLASRITRSNHAFEADPYKEIGFVKQHPHLRGLAKKLVSAMLCREAGRPSTFPDGEKKNSSGKTISLREEFNLPKRARVSDYINDILHAFPFLSELQGIAGELMYLESEVVLECMERLLDAPNPIVTYPVHDCLICKRSDEQPIVDMLWSVMKSRFGAYPSLDVDSLDRDQPTIHEGFYTSHKKVGFHDCYWDDEDFDLIEDE